MWADKVLDTEHPLPSLLVGRVLPQWLYAFLEEVVVGAYLQHAGWFNVVEHPPKMLNLGGQK